jgi:hypothetical protein
MMQVSPNGEVWGTMGYAIACEKSGACITYDGTVTFDDFMGAVLAIHESPDYARLRYAIHDMGTVDQLDFSQVNMTHIVVQELGARFTNPHIKVSVVTSDPTMSKMVVTFIAKTQLDVRVFPVLHQAREWSASIDLT